MSNTLNSATNYVVGMKVIIDNYTGGHGYTPSEAKVGVITAVSVREVKVKIEGIDAEVRYNKSGSAVGSDRRYLREWSAQYVADRKNDVLLFNANNNIRSALGSLSDRSRSYTYGDAETALKAEGLVSEFYRKLKALGVGNLPDLKI